MRGKLPSRAMNSIVISTDTDPGQAQRQLSYVAVCMTTETPIKPPRQDLPPPLKKKLLYKEFNTEECAMPVCFVFFLGEGGGGGGDQNHDHCLIVETCCDTNAAQNQPFSSVPSRLSPTNTLTLQDTTVLVKDGRLVRLHTDTTGHYSAGKGR